jgi:hypothetical protein
LAREFDFAPVVCLFSAARVAIFVKLLSPARPAVRLFCKVKIP